MSHIKNKNPTCRIVKHFLGECNHPRVPFKYLGFLIINVLSNVEHQKMILNDIRTSPTTSVNISFF